MDRWVGKVAVVTGASAGIGAYTVKALAEKGIIVVALARREDKMKELAASYKGTVHTKQCDVTKEEDIVNAFDWIENNLGGVDILINNAGVAKPASLATGKTEAWKSILDTNVLGLSICTREALKTMRKRGDNGHIIHINSFLGHWIPSIMATVTIGMYSSSKFAVTALTEALRLELQGLGSKIRITSISPGHVHTEMASKFVADLTGAEPQPPGPVPEACLEPVDISDAILYCLGTRPIIQVHELIIQPVGQKF